MGCVEAWRDWRRTPDGLTWRVAVAEDMPAIERIWRAKAMVLGVTAALPDLFAPPVVLTLVAENEAGRVVDGMFLEAVLDCTKLGARLSGFQSLTGIAEELASFARSRSFRRITAAMPEKVSERMADGLEKAGFNREQLCLWDRPL